MATFNHASRSTLQRPHTVDLQSELLPPADASFTRREASKILSGAVLCLLTGCQKTSPKPNSPETKVKVAPTPLGCPAGKEFLSPNVNFGLTQDEHRFANDAFYLWMTAVGPEKTAKRLERLSKLPIIPPVERLDPGKPINAVLIREVSAARNAAAYIYFEYETTDKDTGKVISKAVEGFQIQQLTGFFAFVGAIGHESLHAIQDHSATLSTKAKARESLHGALQFKQQKLREEGEAYGQELTDQLAVVKFLRESPLIDSKDRELYLPIWLTDFAGAFYSSNFYYHRVVVQFHLATLALTMLDLQSQVQTASPELGDELNRIIPTITPLIDYTAEAPVTSSSVEKIYNEVKEYLSEAAAHPSANNVQIKELNDRIKTILTTATPWLQKLDSAISSFDQWKQNPAPFKN